MYCRELESVSGSLWCASLKIAKQKQDEIEKINSQLAEKVQQEQEMKRQLAARLEEFEREKLRADEALGRGTAPVSYTHLTLPTICSV